MRRLLLRRWVYMLPCIGNQEAEVEGHWEEWGCCFKGGN